MGIVPGSGASVIAVCNESEQKALATAILEDDVPNATIEVSEFPPKDFSAYLPMIQLKVESSENKDTEKSRLV